MKVLLVLGILAIPLSIGALIFWWACKIGQSSNGSSSATDF